MDLAYDHIAEQTYSGDRSTTPTPSKDPADATTPRPSEPRQNLQTEFQDTFKAFSNSPWGAKLGGFWGNVRKQGEVYYEEARKEAEAASNEALKGFTELKEQITHRTRSLSMNEKEQAAESSTDNVAAETTTAATTTDEAKLEDNDTFIARFRSEAAKRLKEVQKAEDAADEALLRFGTNISNFLRDAVAVSPPSDHTGSTEVIFESKDPSSGKRVIHASRLDAQLHVIQTTLSSFSQDPSDSGGEWDKFKTDFNIEKKTDAIATDLERYPELRSSMEKLVPEKVEHKDFWIRYYFLRHVVEAQEEKRKELLKATTNEAEEVAWDEDSDDENVSSTPQTQEPQKLIAQQTNESTHTITRKDSTTEGLKPEGRRSHDEKSVADSDASYDLVSGATSRAPPSPKEDVAATTKAKVEESDEEDWE